MSTETAKRLEHFLTRRPLLITLVHPGNPQRFRNRLYGIVRGSLASKIPSIFSDPGQFVAVKLSEPKKQFHLWKDKVIFFDVRNRIWLGYEDDSTTPRFFVEIGTMYNHVEHLDPSTWKSGRLSQYSESRQAVIKRSDTRAGMDEFAIAI